MPSSGGVIFRAGERLSFLPTTIALRVAPTPAIARVPGGPPELCGVAFVDGDMIPIVSAAGAGALARSRPRGEAMLLCSILGEVVGLIGVEIVATGRFEPTDGGDVRHEGEVARTFDLAHLIAKVQRGGWGATLSE